MGGGSSIPAADKALQVACKAGDLEGVKKALTDGADANASSPEPALILAAWWGQHTIVKYLFDECKEDGACENLDKDVRSQKVSAHTSYTSDLSVCFDQRSEMSCVGQDWCDAQVTGLSVIPSACYPPRLVNLF